MFKNPTGRSFPGIWKISPGDRNANSAAAMIGAPQSFIFLGSFNNLFRAGWTAEEGQEEGGGRGEEEEEEYKKHVEKALWMPDSRKQTPLDRELGISH